MRRRDFISLLGGAAAAWPRCLRAQSQTPVIGFLGSTSADVYGDRLRAFRQGLKEEGFSEGQNVAIEYRWAEGQNSRLPTLAADLVGRGVNVLVAGGGTPSALAAKVATSVIPIVFAVAVDPVEVGLVTSLNRPGGNMTGVTNQNVDIGSKRLELLHQLLPTATVFGVLVDPTNAALSEGFSRSLQAAARTLGLQVRILHASTDRDFDPVFATLKQERAGGLIIGPSTLYNGWAKQLATLALRNVMPAIFQYRPFAAAGGLISYGTDEIEYYRLVGSYAGQILAGKKPGDLPVQQSTKVELVINLKTAKELAITVPLALLGRADEVIE